MDSHPRTRRRGFTLVELLVVIGIIALLVSILLPVLSSARESGRTVKCLSNLRSIGQGVMLYASVFDGYLPPSNITASYSNDANIDRTNWWYVVDGYIYPERGMTNATNGDPSEVFRCPSALVDGGIAHYAAPRRVMVQLGSPDDELYRLARARRSTEMIMVGDGVQRLDVDQFQPNGNPNLVWARAGERYNNAVSEVSPNAGFFNPERADTFDPIPDSEPGSPNFENADGSTNGYVRWRHDDDTKAAFVFFDGHAEARAIGTVLRANMRPDR